MRSCDLDDAAVDLELEVPAGVAEPALARGQLAEVAVVEDRELGAEQPGRGLDVVAHVGDHAQPELVADVAQRVGVEQPAVLGARRLLRERRDALGPALDGEVVDAGLVEDLAHQRDRVRGGRHQRRVLPGVGVDRRAAYGVRGRRRQRRGDDHAGLVVAVRRDRGRGAARRTARRRRRPRRRPGPRRPAARSCAAPRRPRPAARPTPRRWCTTVSTRSISRSSSVRSELEVAAGLVLVLQRPLEAEQRHDRGVRVDLERGPVDLQPEQRGRPGRRG